MFTVCLSLTSYKRDYRLPDGITNIVRTICFGTLALVFTLLTMVAK